MLPDDSFQDVRRDRVVPRSFRIYDSNRSMMADSETIDLRPIDALIGPGQAEFFQPVLQVVPGFEAFFHRSTFGLGLVRAQEYVTPNVIDLQLVNELCKTFGSVRFVFHISILAEI
jgi:hypothetical protein